MTIISSAWDCHNSVIGVVVSLWCAIAIIYYSFLHIINRDIQIFFPSSFLQYVYSIENFNKKQEIGVNSEPILHDHEIIKSSGGIALELRGLGRTVQC